MFNLKTVNTFILIATALTFGLSTLATASGTIDDSSGGGTYIEAEDYTGAGDYFTEATSETGYNGTAYLNAEHTNTGGSADGSPYEYSVDFPTAGTYYLWFRGHSDNSNNKNSLYYGIDGAAQGDYAAPEVDSWAWDNDRQSSAYGGTNPISITVTSGTHTINIWSREDDYKFDAMFITKDSSVSVSASDGIPSFAEELDPTDTSSSATGSDDGSLAQIPLILSNSVKPQVMLNMSNDHQLYFSAYSDFDDLDSDGAIDGTYLHSVTYYGYFDSSKCYDYNSSDGRFDPVNVTNDKYCGGSGEGDWSGNFLNWASTARIDAVRKILYGGYRSTDTSSLTVLERSYLPNDAHSWVKHYSGDDIDQLTPFSSINSDALTTTSGSLVTIGTGNRTFTTGFTSDEVQVGDQIVARYTTDPTNYYMGGTISSISGSDITIAVTSAAGSGEYDVWTLSNVSRKGITLCNTTAASGYSQDVSAAPLLRIAYGDYNLWTSNERFQCRWEEEVSNSSQRDNGNNIGETGMTPNRFIPDRSDVGLGENDYEVRVQVCASEALIGDESCQEYPAGNLKPIGVLQTHGETDDLYFGLFTGSYTKNKSGGVLRKNVGTITDEINTSTDGTFSTAPTAGAIIDTINKLRIYGYDHDEGTYNDSNSSGGDDCDWGLGSFNDGRCSNWGNPQSEIFLESLRYFAGASANGDFTVSGDDKIDDLTSATWSDPLDSLTYCAPLNIINFNASMASYDADQLTGVSDLNTSDSAADLTDVIGDGESIHGNSWLIGENGADDNQLCTSKSVSSLGDVEGICPEAPRLDGSYHIAGLAHHAFTSDIRDDLEDDQTVKTFGVALAPAVPHIDISVPDPSGGTSKPVTILPACRNTYPNPDGNCAIVNFKKVSVETTSTTASGTFFVQWEDSEQGGDYDQDMSGFIRYSANGTTGTLTVTTDVTQTSTSQPMGFGYIVSGTDADGFHVHSGTDSFTYTDTSVSEDCSGGCTEGQAATTVSYNVTGVTSGQLEQPLYYAAKWGGYNIDDTDHTFPTDGASWDADGDEIPDSYFYATNPSELESSLGEVFSELAEISSSSASVASNSTQLQSGTAIFQAKYNSTDWSGEFLAYTLTLDTDGDVVTAEAWEAESELPAHGSRNIFTFNPTAASSPYGVSFEWANLTAAQQTLLNTSIASLDDGLGSDRVSYFRGDSSVEEQNGGSLRNRTLVDGESIILGDIINSDPNYVGTPNYGYSILSGTEGTAYTAFRATTDYANRTGMVYVGTNHGMLHGFNAETGEEEFAYVPNAVLSYLPKITTSNYGSTDNGHHYLVDGSPKIGDAYFDSAWHTVLLGSLGAGGQAIFALDVTTPGSFSADDVLWEIDVDTQDSSSNYVYADLGVTMAQPTIGRLASGQWVAFIANGYHSANGKAVLYVVDIATGLPLDTAYGTIDVGVGDLTTQNGLSTPVPVDIDGDKITDYVYAGDLLGNMWKFDFTDATPANWGVAYVSGSDPAPLFTALGPSGETQPITVRPTVGRHPSNGIMVWFGTGKFFDSNDNVVDSVVANRPVYSFYGIQDSGSAITTTDRSELVGQTIVFEGQVEIPSTTPTEYYFDGQEIRVMSDSSVNYSLKDGWYIDLVSPNTPTKQTERVVEQAALDSGKIIFVTLIPSDNPCESGGTSWLMEVDPYTGGRFDYAIYDANDDGDIDSDDLVTVQDSDGNDIAVSVSGLASTEGILQSPAILDNDSDVNVDSTGNATGTQIKVFSGSTGNLMFQEEVGGDVSTKGRHSWRQMR